MIESGAAIAYGTDIKGLSISMLDLNSVVF